MPIKVECYGASREVGRSSFLVDAGDKVLLDHGVKLGPERTEYPAVVKANINAIILSHAHLDHSGNIPHFFRYSHALTFMTPPTLELSKLLWYDSIKIADKEGEPPKFTKKEIERVEKYAFPTNYRRRLKVTDRISFEFLDAGHIMGAALTKLYLGNKTLLYTGDFKDEETRLFPGADVKGAGEVDYLMIESCYGNREHTPRKEAEKKFVESVKETLDNGGHALVPAFAIGRTQEIIEVLYEHNVQAPIYFDGMGQKAARIFFHYPEYLKTPTMLKRALEQAVWVESNSDRKKALAQPSVIVTTSGMLTGGAVYAYLDQIVPDKKSKIMLTGYQVRETPGRVLREKGVLNVEGRETKVTCGVDMFEFSAHVGRSGLHKAVKKWNPEKVIVVHGDPDVEDQFAADLKAEGFDTVAPAIGDTVTLK